MKDELIKHYVEELQKCNTGDWECDHGNADDLIVELLRELGYEEVANAWEENPPVKWYA